jgi:DNA repair photolyase
MTGRQQQGPRGRGTASNPINRFEMLEVVAEEPLPDRVPTVFLRDASRTILARNESPDVPFDVSINPYRGCEHGCAYCYARPTHEYLGFSAGLDFETRILIKETAPELLQEELESPHWKPEVIGISGVTDPYQPVERRLELTRRCLEVLALYRNPVALITKNHLVTRDIDLLAELAGHRAAVVVLSITTLDGGLTQQLEPRTSHPRDRLRALRELARRQIPCGVLVAPIIPGLNDHEIPAILEAAADAGAGFASSIPLRLPPIGARKFSTGSGRRVAASSTIPALAAACRARGSLPTRSRPCSRPPAAATVWSPEDPSSLPPPSAGKAKNSSACASDAG